MYVVDIIVKPQDGKDSKPHIYPHKPLENVDSKISLQHPH